MLFTQEFKLEVYQTLKDDSNIHQLMTILESKNETNYSQARILLESILYRTELQLKPRILKDLGDMEVYNGAVRYYQLIQKVYTQLLDLINAELDKKEIVLKSKNL
tara:strand:- start:25889 stop:26206 length:318 start_codon:yes stop_codon:yes gene_type:complete